MVSSCTASTVEAGIDNLSRTSEMLIGISDSRVSESPSCSTCIITALTHRVSLMFDSQVAGALPRSHSPVLRWIRNPLSLGRGGSNPSLGANHHCHQPFFSDFGGSGGMLLRFVNQKVPTEPSANFISTLRSAFTSVISPSWPSNCSNSELRGDKLF